MLKIRLKKGVIGRKPDQRKTVQALGLKKINQTREIPDNDCTRGMLRKVHNLVEVVEE